MKKIFLTGATDGIGLEAAKLFAKNGHTLLLHGRSVEKLENVHETLSKINNKSKITVYSADFSDLDSVHSMIDKILVEQKFLDVLINNAGVFVAREDQAITQNNLDIRFQVNTLVPYLLTKKLSPLLKSGSRVVNVASAAQAPINFSALRNSERLSASEAYAQSKLALMVWSMALAEDATQEASIITLNPKSFLGSKMVKEAYGQQGHDLSIGAQILYNAALSEAFATANGKYFDNDYGEFVAPHPFVKHKAQRTALLEFLDTFTNR